AANFDQSVLSCSSKLCSECFPGFCIHQQTLIPISKKCTTSGCGSRPPKRAKFARMAEHFEYNHIPAHLSSIQNFHVKSVLCYRGHLIVLHLVRNMASQFGLVDLQINKFLGIFGKQFTEFSVELVRGEIAPDETKCLVLMPSVRYPHFDVLHLYDLRTKEALSEVGY
uniref:RING-type E3 ubiquitin transferase n=1 Tax=Macrostomum lignano TaxID=282301 RepID=A0A1I8GBV1_9PLAT